MASIAAVAFAALAQASVQAGVRASGPETYYQCEVSRESAGGRFRAGSISIGQEQPFDAWARWDQARARNDVASFSIRWQLDRNLRPDSGVVDVEVPARKGITNRTVIGLRRPDDTRPGSMSLNGSVLRFSPGAWRPSVEVDLGTLLALSEGVESLRWAAFEPRSGEGRGSGTIAMAPLREAAVTIAGVVEELAGKQARRRSDCILLDGLPQPEPHP